MTLAKFWRDLRRCRRLTRSGLEAGSRRRLSGRTPPAVAWKGASMERGNDPLPPEEGSKPSGRRCNIWQGYFPYKDFGTDGHAGTAPVKSYQPNGFGLYDMTGNVWEICGDH